MDNGQSIVLISTFIIYILTAVLAFYLSREYARHRKRSDLFWSLGIWAFAVSVLLEIIFAMNVYSQLLIGAYFLLVAIVVELLALGSVQLVRSGRIRRAYYVFTALISIVLLYFTVTSNFGYDISNYIVVGVPPPGVLYTSTIATVVASIAIIAVAAKSYMKTRNKKLLSIILGVMVVASAGTLYIASFPVFLYYAEFFGILLLWFGFIKFNR